MAYQYKREPLSMDEANRLTNACKTHEEKIVVWVLLDTGLRVNELSTLKRENIDWQGHRLVVFGKGGPYGKKTKRRVVPLTTRSQTLLEGHFTSHETFNIGVRKIQRIIKSVANRANISRSVMPHVLRHTFAVTAVQKGLSLPSLMKILGHDHLSTTQIYLNMSPEMTLNEFHDKW